MQHEGHIVGWTVGEIVIILAQAMVLPPGQSIVGYTSAGVLITLLEAVARVEDKARTAAELHHTYVIRPSHPRWNGDNWANGRALPDGFRHQRSRNSAWLTTEHLQELIASSEPIGLRFRRNYANLCA